MVTTYTTSQECYDYITATSGTTVAATTRPAEGSLDHYRKKAYSLIYPIALTMSDPNYILWGIEIELVKIQWEAANQGLVISLQLTEQQINGILGETDGNANNSSWEPGRDSIFQW